MDGQKLRKLVLEDGSTYIGTGFGSGVDKVCEIVFNTAMIGYQEVISNPSCTYAAVVMTYPLIGNYGIADEDYETKIPTLGALIVRDYNDNPSNFRYTKTLSEVMEENGIPGISGIDTRKLTRYIRDNGSCKVLITDADTPQEEAMATLANTEIPRDAVAQVSCKKRWYSRTANAKYNVVAVDCGIKHNIIRCLNDRSCNVTIVPYTTSFEEIERMHPDGVVISNGPGNPEDVPQVEALVGQLRGKYPLLGISLGHLLICRAYGAKTYKMKRGHNGGHPVKNVITGKVTATAQGHGYAVDEASLAGAGLTLTHVDVLDGTVEGVACAEDRVISLQFHPESAPGAQDCMFLFDEFIKLMEVK
ncbi:MAG: glutamine-hydrolyzing carbamoyl-phosphate synthase small subunit [Firmicutes bacterium]|nr:glutamine-hydrolyzing carbamoyl-phosphate synthase small subunit [Bacillota bacterium]